MYRVIDFRLPFTVVNAHKNGLEEQGFKHIKNCRTFFFNPYSWGFCWGVTLLGTADNIRNTDLLGLMLQGLLGQWNRAGCYYGEYQKKPKKNQVLHQQQEYWGAGHIIQDTQCFNSVPALEIIWSHYLFLASGVLMKRKKLVRLYSNNQQQQRRIN